MLARSLRASLVACSLVIAAGSWNVCAAQPAVPPVQKAVEKAAPKAESKAAQPKPAQPKPLAPIEDDPKLPRVLLLGDSISIGYTLPVRAALKGVANVHRPSENCMASKHGVAKLDGWLGEGKWDVIHFNFGLHDLKYIDETGKNTSPAKGRPQVSLEDYEKNLRAIVARLKETKAKLIFCYTTPVPDGEPQRVHDDALKYNAVAKKVMDEEGVAINDLHSFVMARQAEIQRPKNVHFTEPGSQALGEQVAGVIQQALSTEKPASAK